MSNQPGILTTVVGSFPLPEWCGPAVGQDTLDDAARVIIGLQEDAGIDVVCDGEVYRRDPNHPQTNGMVGYFMDQMSGYRRGLTIEELDALSGRAHPADPRRFFGVVEAALSGGRLNLGYDCARGQALARTRFKFTVTGPHTLASCVQNTHYADKEALIFAIAEVLAAQVARCRADVVQLDEASLPRMPEEADMAAQAINVVLDAIPGAKAVHLCLGNYGGQRSSGAVSWDRLLGYLNQLRADHLILENKHRPQHEVDVFRDLRPDLALGLGVIDIKTLTVETPDQVARDIERIEQSLGPGRLAFIHPDCGCFLLPRSVALSKFAALVDGRNLYAGKTEAAA